MSSKLTLGTNAGGHRFESGTSRHWFPKNIKEDIIAQTKRAPEQRRRDNRR